MTKCEIKDNTTGFRALLICDEVFDSITGGLLAEPEDLVILDTERNIDDKDAFDLLIELARQSKHWQNFLDTDSDIEEIRKNAFDNGVEYRAR
jgi:hypothetical protein